MHLSWDPSPVINYLKTKIQPVDEEGKEEEESSWQKVIIEEDGEN